MQSKARISSYCINQLLKLGLIEAATQPGVVEVPRAAMELVWWAGLQIRIGDRRQHLQVWVWPDFMSHPFRHGKDQGTAAHQLAEAVLLDPQPPARAAAGIGVPAANDRDQRQITPACNAQGIDPAKAVGHREDGFSLPSQLVAGGLRQMPIQAPKPDLNDQCKAPKPASAEQPIDPGPHARPVAQPGGGFSDRGGAQELLMPPERNTAAVAIGADWYVADVEEAWVGHPVLRAAGRRWHRTTPAGNPRGTGSQSAPESGSNQAAAWPAEPLGTRQGADDPHTSRANQRVGMV